jgi:hypothetical protein
MTPITINRDHLASMAVGVAVQRLRDGLPAVPLTSGQADAQALRLREAGLSYGAIARVMRSYHGVGMNENTWRHRLRRLGVEPKPHGVPFSRSAA